jgi:hypothetical protein
VNTDELGSALDHLAGRADGTQPSDRVAAVHRRARRNGRVRVGTATAVVALLVGSAVALVSRTHDDAGGQVPGGVPSTSAPSVATTASQVATSPTPTQASTPAGSPTSVHTAALVPADAQFPAAGGCPWVTGTVVTVDANPDVPTPRCVSVRADQVLRVVNTSAILGSPPKTITVTWADFAPRVLQAGQSTTFGRPFGEYLANGVHFLHMPPLYAGSNGEVWMH